ncbi:dihydrofolate reductase family protein [Cellulosimicrobium arenosum]|uniref:Dihydrofolate reductase family protein n=1 Tax=Cellulosimicrobium arenosum TaxID=2708133 RepID=A0A927G7L9_9MICO|nr:dihydrofolate reductase family protein [Cellulosimicrobium arenosum]MBD8078373.1 dihydrofolate reductase family protein [Cellulosimicrobium arenosum]
MSTGIVTTSASVSLDGFIAGPGETGIEHLFEWYDAGTEVFPSANPGVSFNLSAADHAYLTAAMARIGALVVGRHLFDITDGWGGTHPLDKPVVVLTHHVPHDWVAAHPAAPFRFVTTGIEDAVAAGHEAAGGLDVAVNAGRMASQALAAGLLEEVVLDVVPVLLGGGVPFFDDLGAAPRLLDGPEITPGERVTHLRFSVRAA